ncbi:polyketide synthase [Chryseobacterium sp. BIGb0232]|uniref:polyketide synthase n=1 Tax=Chryseobacterium sp. BIGb0232 TaxID=2940598 RepID=UPI000F464EC5|nr:polyketide synthase [Chryseobacterium sp. BIGb0232]MCS4304846.1 polyketide biosynthesis enoyl-CoA hydratase PksI [Chryseobacterium sp. BIGb0232]ROS09729.1 polyketide biosynthesis enoyl-CoA hydratase PksI [Chryseobacterium nakagawai]
MERSVIETLEITPSILQVVMKDEEYKNAFSPELTDALVRVFENIASNEKYKAVILTGYSNYFASGGSMQGLLDIYDKKIKFSDSNLYSLALNCPIPVISAMQGHAIGGGFVMGLFADFVVLSRESIYTTNFMRYGFTPGMGATYILPKKLGLALSEEMLLSGSNFRGDDLEKRGIPFKVLPRTEVLPYAQQLANQLAEKPRLALVTLKDHLVKQVRQELSKVIDEELTMHEITFHHPEVKERILNFFGK